MNKQEFNDLLLELNEQGYKNSPPPEDPLGMCNVDVDVCHQVTCHRCGHKGMDYHPMLMPGVSYRAFAVCPGCGEVMEF